MANDRFQGLAEKALSSTDRAGQGLRAVNEKLADLVASLRDQKQRLAGFSTSPPRPAVAPERAEPAADAASPDRALASELALAREALAHRDEEQQRLRERLAEIEAENRRVCDEFVAVQEQNAELVSVYAAIERLHGAPSRPEVLSAIQEIVINVIGSEEFALFELAPDGGRLLPVHSFGVERGALPEIAIGAGVVGRCAAEGATWVAGEGPPAPREDRPVTACVPLRHGERVTGAIAIYGLLGHKPALTEFDREMFSLLERHAALALHLRAAERPAGAR